MKVRNPVKMSTEVEKLEASLTSIFLEEGLSIENPLAKKMIHDFVMEMLEEIIKTTVSRDFERLLHILGFLDVLCFHTQ